MPYLLLILVFFLNLSRVFASHECSVPINRHCSSEYHIVSTVSELESYLKSPAVDTRGRQKNLKVDLDLTYETLSLGVACTLRVKRGNRLEASQGNLCLSAKNILIENDVQISSTKKVSLYAEGAVELGASARIEGHQVIIESQRKVKLAKGSVLNAIFAIDLKTNQSSSLNEGISLEKESSLRAQKIRVSSSASLSVSALSSLSSENLSFQAQFCEVSDRAVIQNLRGRVVSRTTLGSCLKSLPGDFDLRINKNRNELHQYEFFVSGLKKGQKVFFRLDGGALLEERKFTREIDQLGIHLVEAIVLDQRGRSQKLQREVRVKRKREKIPVGKVIDFYFHHKKSGENLTGTFNEEEITLYAVKEKPGLYLWLTDQIPPGARGELSLSQYQGSLSFGEKPQINNSLNYLTSELETLKRNVKRTPSSDFSIQEFEFQLSSLIDEFKVYLLTVDPENLKEMADFYAANKMNSQVKRDSFLIEQKNHNPSHSREDVVTEASINVMNGAALAILGMENVIRLSPLMTNPRSSNQMVSGPWALSALVTMWEGYRKWNYNVSSLYHFTQYANGSLVSGVVVDRFALMPTRMTAKYLSTSTATTEVQRNILKTIEEGKKSLERYNASIEKVNSAFETYGFSTRIGALSIIEVPVGAYGEVGADSQYVTVALISSEHGGVILEETENSQGKKGFKVSSGHVQNVTLSFKYSHKYMGEFEKEASIGVYATDSCTHGGKLHEDGSCDWALPEIRNASSEVVYLAGYGSSGTELPGPPTTCNGLYIGVHVLAVKNIRYTYDCYQPELQTYAPQMAGTTAGIYSCHPGDNGWEVRFMSTGASSEIARCRNPEGEMVEMPL